MFWILDLIQQGQITRNRGEIDSANTRLARAERALETIDPLPERLERLALVSQAMWELLRDKLGLHEQEVLEKVREIDLRDGREDGKLKIGVKNCESCGRVMNRRHKKCVYCGADKLLDSVFELV